MKRLGKMLGAGALLALLTLFMIEAIIESTFMAEVIAKYNTGSSMGLARMIVQAKGEFETVINIICTVFYIASIVLTSKAIFKFKEFNNSKGQVPLSSTILLLIVASFLFVLANMITYYKSNTVGSGHTINPILYGIFYYF
jgi:hypothetical protein